MQQTALDRWLRQEFVYVCQVYANSLPDSLPGGVVLEDAGEDFLGRYRYCFTTRNDRQLNELTARLEVANITYTSRVAERDGALARLFNRPDKSFTLQMIWLIVSLIVIAVSFSGLPLRLWITLTADDDPVVEKPRPAATAPARP